MKEIKKSTKITISAESLIQLLSSEWQDGAQNSPGYSNANSIFAGDKYHSAENAESFRQLLKKLEATW